MKIPVWYQPPAQEVEVEISLDDIVQYFESFDGESDVLRFLNSAARVFNAIPDNIIQEMSYTHRKLLNEYLTSQAARF